MPKDVQAICQLVTSGQYRPVKKHVVRGRKVRQSRVWLDGVGYGRTGLDVR